MSDEKQETRVDRLDAAAKREKEQPGNAAAMRDALEAVVDVGYPHNFQREAPHIREYCYDITEAIKKCFAALSAPAPTTEKSSVVGDVAAMREAAVTAYDALEKIKPFSLKLGDVGRMREFNHLVCLAKNRLDAALSAPPRNCDVGTAEEQEARFKVFCESHWDLNNPSSECAGCPLDERVGTDCEFAWAQMPYEAKEGGAE